MDSNATRLEIENVLDAVYAHGFKPHLLSNLTGMVIGLTGNQALIETAGLDFLPGVAGACKGSRPYVLASRDFKKSDTIIRIGQDEIGGADPVIIAGPCAVESYDQTMQIAEAVASCGITFFRGGAFKPRTSPYSFQGLGKEGLLILSEARNQFGLKIVSEVLDTENFDIVEDFADVLQIGARNMQNFSLLRRAGQTQKPVLLKRGMSSTLEEWLLAAEYILHEGNYNVILCERGVRTFADHSRNTLDLSILPVAQRLSHLPIIIDPSHGTGRRDSVKPLARAGIAAGAKGVMVEVHNHPELALSDGPQALLPEDLKPLVAEIHAIKHAITQLETTFV
jgi:3-deoxy-7-phosphoheptulonate synthase